MTTDAFEDDEEAFWTDIDYFKYHLAEERGLESVDELPESDEQLRQMMDDNEQAAWRAMLNHERAQSLIHSRNAQDQRRMDNRLKVLRWLSFHHNSRLTILASVLGQSVQGAANVCNKMVRDKLLVKSASGYYGRRDFLLYGITRTGLDHYHNTVESDPETTVQSPFRVTPGVETHLEHDHAVQWVQLHLESIKHPEQHRQHWISEHLLPHFGKPGKAHDPKRWKKYPDGILYHSPWSWRHEYDDPRGPTSQHNKSDLYQRLSDTHWLDKTGHQGDYGYLNLAVEVERTIKSPARYQNHIRAHEENIEKGHYDIVLYLFSTDTKRQNAQHRFEQALRQRHQSSRQPNSPYTYESQEPQWQTSLRQFQFDRYDQYLPNRSKSAHPQSA